MPTCDVNLIILISYSEPKIIIMKNKNGSDVWMMTHDIGI